MRPSQPFAELSELLERIESSGASVVDVDVDAGALTTDGTVAADVSVRAPLCGDGTAADLSAAGDRPSVGPDGTLQCGLTAVVSLPTDSVDVAAQSVEIREGGTLVVTLRTTLRGERTDAETDAAREATDVAEGPTDRTGGSETGTNDPDADRSGTGNSGDSGEAGRSVPLYRKTARLREVYRKYDTFAEMTEALDAPVTAETVRRYMIDNGIHEPATYDTGASGEEDDDGATATSADEGVSAEPEVGPGDTAERSAADEGGILADGIGLPEGVTVERLSETVYRATTIYEVQEEFDVCRRRTLEMLRELNLLDLVTGRLAMEEQRRVTREEINERLRESAAR